MPVTMRLILASQQWKGIPRSNKWVPNWLSVSIWSNLQPYALQIRYINNRTQHSTCGLNELNLRVNAGQPNVLAQFGINTHTYILVQWDLKYVC